ncbi:hypothetical protein FMEAI12_6020007 [Parafrankia sp. Ea1.12]|nr:hypothetical protein FMEAI12_6020007 [Parafrankia sp. Ea1.12]
MSATGPGGHTLLDALAHHGYTHLHAPLPLAGRRQQSRLERGPRLSSS